LLLSRPFGRSLWLGVGISLALAKHLGAAVGAPCFDFRAPVAQPMRPPIPLLAEGDNLVFGTYPDGIDWASARGLVQRPITTVYPMFLDHRNLKDKTRTTVVTTVLERPGYLAFHNVDVTVRIRALFFKFKLEWTEAWGYSLVEGTRDAPLKILMSYQKIAGTPHIEHQCGSYVLWARDSATTDVSLYEEVKADRRSAEDTRDMHKGTLATVRAGAR
jgi:hypothetical protein